MDRPQDRPQKRLHGPDPHGRSECCRCSEDLHRALEAAEEQTRLAEPEEMCQVSLPASMGRLEETPQVAAHPATIQQAVHRQVGDRPEITSLF